MADADQVFCFKNARVNRKGAWKPEYLKVFRKFKRNKLRILRRKRSKLRYRARRKAERIVRKADDLCSIISACDITDQEMQWDSPPNPITGAPPMLAEVASWQAQHQITYWKSRALAVEYENRILHRILRETQIKQVEDYIENMELQNTEYKRIENIKQHNHERRRRPTKEPEHHAPPTDQERNERQERMMTLYGKMAPRISGMETALELNYEQYEEKYNPPFWPNIPLRL